MPCLGRLEYVTLMTVEVSLAFLLIIERQKKGLHPQLR